MSQTAFDLGALFNIVDIGIFVHDPETGLILDANRQALAMVQCTLEELRRLPPAHFFSNLPGFTTEVAIERVRQAGKGIPQQFLWQGRDHSGELHWLRVDLQKASLQGRTLVLALCRDVTRERAQEQSRIETEARYKAMVEAFDGLIYICSADYRVEFMNQRFIERTGRSAVGELCYKALHGLDTVCSWCVNDRVQRGETVRWEVQSPLDHRWYYVVNTPLRHADGRISKQALIIDVSDRRDAEEKRAEFERRVRETQRLESLGHLAGGVAHDFNNLLLIMLGEMDLALGSLPDDSPVRQNLQEGIKAAQKASGICRQMLTYAGKGLFVPQRFDLNVQVRDLESLLRLSVSRNAELVVDLDASELFISGDPSQLHQVILNLVINGSEALEQQSGRITIRTGAGTFAEVDLACRWLNVQPAAGSYAWLEVTDTGSGIPEEHLPHLFDPFFSTKFTGRGLGLAAVLGIVRGHQGSIRVDSKPGRGTTMRVCLPLHVPSQAAAVNTVPAPPATRAPSHPLTILVVDDEPLVLQLTTELVQSLGYQAVTATRGKQALEMVQTPSNHIDAVLLDQSMPELDGTATFLQLRVCAPHLPVILTSGFHEDDSIKDLYQHGLVGFLPKPYLIEDLARLLSQALAKTPAP